MPIGKQLKNKLSNTNAFEKKHNEFLKEIKEFKNNKELQNEYKRVQEVLEESIEERETGN
ncbi:hypothetical protein [Bacillus pumilus]|uniref:hypothetical protein n=1 Tax=Bacillus pumilus TaxID=1408 RepID=UPI0011A48A2A|nr:hypothetical protein [Bacillus pumilus]